MNKIAALIDFTEVTQKVIEFSARQARAHDAELYLLHVEPNNAPTLYRKIDEAERKRIADVLRHEHFDLLAKAAQLRERFDIKIHPVLIEGSEVEKTVVAEVEKLQVNHVILGNHRHSGFYNYLFGSVGQMLIKRLNCPLTLIPDTDASQSA